MTLSHSLYFQCLPCASHTTFNKTLRLQQLRGMERSCIERILALSVVPLEIH